MFAYVTENDVQRWKSQNRHDLVEFAQGGETIWAGDRIISSSSGDFMKRCPFLKMHNGIYTCEIYETRPEVCSGYEPGSSALCPEWSGYSPDVN